jgi:hypothetical protein
MRSSLSLLQAGGRAGEPLSESFGLLNDVPNDELARLVHLDTHRLLVSFHIPIILPLMAASTVLVVAALRACFCKDSPVAYSAHASSRPVP